MSFSYAALCRAAHSATLLKRRNVARYDPVARFKSTHSSELDRQLGPFDFAAIKALDDWSLNFFG